MYLSIMSALHSLFSLYKYKAFDKYFIASHHLRVYTPSKVLRVNRLNNARSIRWKTYPLNNVNIAFTFHFFVCTGNIYDKVLFVVAGCLHCSVVSPHLHPGNFCVWNPEFAKFFLWNGESWSLESGIQLKESGIPLTIGIQNPSSTDKDWNSVRRIRNPRREIQSPS